MKKPVTIEDIATKAGVGRGTVDRVLHDRGRVAESTRKKVLECIAELEYKPNQAAQMLANRKVYKIAVIYHNKEKEFWEQVEEGIDRAEREYSQMGIRIDRFILPKIDIDKQAETIYKAIDEKYDGLAIVPYCSEKIENAINCAIKKGLYVISFNNDEKCMRNCYVGQNLYQSGRTAGQLLSLIAPKHSRYAIILPVIESMSALYGRYEGFCEVLSEKRQDMELVGTYNFEQDGIQAYHKVKKLLVENRIDAIYASNVIIEDVAKAVEEVGLKDKIILIGHDLTKTIMDYIERGVIDISIGQQPDYQGYVAIEKLCRKLLLDEDVFEDVYTKIEVVIAENLAYV